MLWFVEICNLGATFVGFAMWFLTLLNLKVEFDYFGIKL